MADAFSRFQFQDRFQELVSGAEQQGTPCPPRLWRIAVEFAAGLIQSSLNESTCSFYNKVWREWGGAATVGGG